MKHVEVVCAIINYDNKILCMQRPDGKHKYTSFKYEFPGGKVEEGEKYNEALMRELKEEMDYDLNINEDDFFMTITHEYPDFEITMHSFIVNATSDKFNMKEHIDFKWLDKKDLDSLDWADADVPIMKKLMNE
ncbi:MAG: (deoxy)nucleoside triphosphate pyrophosphohydrolase [Clostridia bacterium]|nr:(deoxy)nucleoside triphosphate pyrophosphohydrolase [Clostridia bacterium]